MRKTPHAELTLTDDTLLLTGELTFANAMIAFDESLVLMANLTQCKIEMTNLTRSDSSTLALMFEWINWAISHNKKIQFLHMPENLQSIATASKLTPLLEPYLVRESK